MSTVTLALSADSADTLISQLRRTDITVPTVNEGHTSKHHRERYMMARFLATVAESDRLGYPLIVSHREKPDFMLKFSDNAIGVECVEAASSEWSHINAIREEQFPDALIAGQRVKPGQRTFTNEERTKIASGSWSGRPWVGKMALRHWAEAMEYFIADKTVKLRAGNYSEFPTSWLLVQDEWPVPIYRPEDVLEAAELCRSRIAKLLEPPCFDAIDICSHRWHLSFYPHRTAIEPIRDLWSDGEPSL